MSETMRNIALLLRYDGSRFHGWQSQKNALSIQDVLSAAIERLTGAPPYPRLEGCGRTDAGVHALAYVANFKSATAIPSERLPFALNPLLPDSIAVLAAADVADDFHARFSCVKKEYVYEIRTARIFDPFLVGRAYFCPLEPDLEAMRRAAVHIPGERDFAAFRAVGTPVKSTVRTLYSLGVEREGNRFTVSVCANGFLYNMARIIAGTLLYAGLGKLDPDDIPDILLSRARSPAGVTLPPQGLYLKRVWYPEGELFAP